MPLFDVKVVVTYQYQVEAGNEELAKEQGWNYRDHYSAAEVYSIEVFELEADDDVVVSIKTADVNSDNNFADRSLGVPNSTLSNLDDSEIVNDLEIVNQVMSCLCHVNGYSDRKDVLVPDEMSREDFENYVKWWWEDSSGESIFKSLAKEIMDSIVEFWPLDQEESLHVFLQDFNNWEDFLRELEDCTLQDVEPNSSGSGTSYFTEYALLNCRSIYDGQDNFSQGHEIIVRVVEDWFKSSQEEIKTSFLKHRKLIAKSFS